MAEANSSQNFQPLLKQLIATNLPVLNLKGVVKVEETSFFLKILKSPDNQTTPISNLDPLKALKEHKRIVVLGEAGTGKSTLLKWLAVAALRGQFEETATLPVIISLPEFVGKKSPRLFDYILERLEETTGSPRLALIEKLLAGQVLLLFDGLDAIQSNRDGERVMIYRLVADQLIRLARHYPRALIAITCRRTGWLDNLPGYVPLQLVESEWEDIQDYIGRWSNLRQPELFQPLTLALLRSVGLRSLAGTPLLLALICLVYEQRGSLPHSRSELYEWCVEVMLEKAEETGIPQVLNALYKQALLRKIALYFHQRGQHDFPREQLVQVIQPFLHELKVNTGATKALLAELVSEYGLLREQSPGIYSFAHFSFQEYFTAEAIAENQQYNLIEGVLGEAWWQEVIILMAGMSGAERLFQILQTASLEQPQLLSLACRCLANQPRLDNPDPAFAILVEAMQMVLDVGKPAQEKAPVVEALSQIKDLAMVNYFSQLFQMRDIQQFLHGDLYALVILNLVQMGIPESFPVVFQLLQQPDISVDNKLKLIEAVVIVGGNSGSIAELRLLLPTLSGPVRAKALLVLLQQGDLTLLAPAVVLLRNRQLGRKLKHRLLNALGRLVAPAEFLKLALPILTVKSNSDPTLQHRALDVIINRGGMDSLLKLLDQLYHHPERYSAQLQARIVEIAGWRGGMAVVPNLLPLLDVPMRTLEPKSPLDNNLKQQALKIVRSLANSSHTVELRHWLRQAHIDYFSQQIAFLLMSMDASEENRAISARFFNTGQADQPDIACPVSPQKKEPLGQEPEIIPLAGDGIEYIYNLQ